MEKFALASANVVPLVRLSTVVCGNLLSSAGLIVNYFANNVSQFCLIGKLYSVRCCGSWLWRYRAKFREKDSQTEGH